MAATLGDEVLLYVILNPGRFAVFHGPYTNSVADRALVRERMTTFCMDKPELDVLIDIFYSQTIQLMQPALVGGKKIGSYLEHNAPVAAALRALTGDTAKEVYLVTKEQDCRRYMHKPRTFLDRQTAEDYLKGSIQGDPAYNQNGEITFPALSGGHEGRTGCLSSDEPGEPLVVGWYVTLRATKDSRNEVLVF